MNVDSVWHERWQVQNDYLTTLIEQYRTSSAPRMETFTTLALCLQAFGESQFKFFNENFANDKLAPSEEFLPSYALSTTLDQIGFDIAMIEKAAAQRVSYANLASGANGDARFSQALELADYLAYAALEPVQPESNWSERCVVLREPTTVLTYFQKSTSVRVIPYAPVVLVGLPYSCIEVSRDFLAIPHEVGHYVYRHGRFFEGSGDSRKVISPRKVLPRRTTAWCARWFEEIFADVYGAMIAGPVIGLDFQDLLSDQSLENFYTDDGDHPVPNLRPHIYMNVIGSKNGRNEDVMAWLPLLEAHWQQHIAARQAQILDDAELRERVGTRFKRQNGQWFDIAAAISTNHADFNAASRKSIDVAVHKVLSELLHGLVAQTWPVGLTSPSDGTSATALYDEFNTYISALPPAGFSVPEVTVSADGMLCVGNFKATRSVGDPHFMPIVDDAVNPFLAKEETEDNEPLETKAWLQILNAAGWTTKGPHCELDTGIC